MVQVYITLKTNRKSRSYDPVTGIFCLCLQLPMSNMNFFYLDSGLVTNCTHNVSPYSWINVLNSGFYFDLLFHARCPLPSNSFVNVSLTLSAYPTPT